MSSACPCGSGATLDACCGQYIFGGKPAPTAEALMRSRYTAYTLCEIDYLKKSLAPSLHEAHDPEAVRQWAENSEWLGLEITEALDGGETDDTGIVEFAATYAMDGTTHVHRERSHFQRMDGQWFYVEGDVIGGPPFRRETPKVGRNEPCPCGSGKKFKKCCG